MLNKDLSRVNMLIERRKVKKKHEDLLQKRYNIKQKGLQTTKEIISQRIKAKVAKIKRYNQRISQFQQNRLFSNNEGRFYQQLNNDQGWRKVKHQIQKKLEHSGLISGAKRENTRKMQNG